MCGQEDDVQDAKKTCKTAQRAVDEALKLDEGLQVMSIDDIIRLVDKEKPTQVGT